MFRAPRQRNQWLRLAPLIPFFCWASLLSAQSPTFFPDIAPIISQNCSPCHHANGSAPFPLTTYDEVQSHGKFIAAVTQRRYMPPWPADPAYRSHRNKRRLTDEEIAAIQDWVAAGMPKGPKSCKNRKQLKYQAAGPEGKPQLVLQPDTPYQVAGDGKDHFVYFLLGESLPEDLWVSSFRFQPGNLRVVHHTELLVAPPGTLDGIGEQVIEEESYYGPAFAEAMGREFEYIAGWLPGNQGEIYPRGTHRKLAKGSRLVLMVHYAPTPVAESDLTALEIYGEGRPGALEVQSLDLHAESHLVDGPLFLPANSSPTFHSVYAVESDFQAFAVFPHAHHLCTSMRAYALLPQGDTLPLMDIPKWDFDWQFTYYFPEFIHLPAGSEVHFTATYDNTNNNPENPFQPPRDIPSSFRSDDEMMELFVWGIQIPPGQTPPDLRFD